MYLNFEFISDWFEWLVVGCTLLGSFYNDCAVFVDFEHTLFVEISALVALNDRPCDRQVSGGLFWELNVATVFDDSRDIIPVDGLCTSGNFGNESDNFLHTRVGVGEGNGGSSVVAHLCRKPCHADVLCAKSATLTKGVWCGSNLRGRRHRRKRVLDVGVVEWESASLATTHVYLSKVHYILCLDILCRVHINIVEELITLSAIVTHEADVCGLAVERNGAYIFLVLNRLDGLNGVPCAAVIQ